MYHSCRQSPLYLKFILHAGLKPRILSMELYPCNCPAEGPSERMLSRNLSRRSEGEKEYSRLPFHSQKPGSSLILGRARHASHMCYLRRKDLATQKTYFLPNSRPTAKYDEQSHNSISFLFTPFSPLAKLEQ